MLIEHDTWLAIVDGEKFLLLQNVGTAKRPALKVIEHETSENAPARELSSDRPGRRQDSGQQGIGGLKAWGKSGMEQTDWHCVAEERFAARVAVQLGDWALQRRFARLVVAADPRTLGALRQAYPDHLKPVVVAEIAKDLANLPLDRIEASLDALGIE